MAKGPKKTKTGGVERALGRPLTEPPPFMFDALHTHATEVALKGENLTAKCIALLSPVGYGKTLLMATLLNKLRGSGKTCFWLALDDRDSSLERVIGELEAALGGGANMRRSSYTLLTGPAPIEPRIDALVDALNRQSEHTVVFIDNLQGCTEPGLGRLLDRLVFQTNRSTSIVFSSTQDPPLNMAHAQMEGLIRQLGPAELSFDETEVAQLLGPRVCKQIGAAGISEVTRRTEGWPAAVRTAQIILSNAEKPNEALKAFSGSDESLSSLLNRSVLSGFPVEVRAFLLRLAQLRTFCLDMCAAAIDAENAAELLAYLIERRVFVIALDRNRQWYRLHGLFRDYLLREAEAGLSHSERKAIQERAARWCEKNGHFREAIECGMAAEAIVVVRQCLDRIAPSMVRAGGGPNQYIRWIEALHEKGARAGLEAEYWFVWALAFQRRYDYARQQGEILTAALRRRRGAAAKRVAGLERRIVMLRISIDTFSDQLLSAYEGAVDWLKGAAKAADDPFDVTAAHCIKAGFFTDALRFVEARRSVQAARESAFQANSAYVNAWVSAYSGLVAMQQGGYAESYHEMIASLSAARAALGDDSGICGTIALVAARCAIGLNLDEQAREHLEFGMKSARTHGFLDATACGLDAALHLWRGGPDERFAPGMLREVAAAYPPRLASLLSCYLIRRLIHLGRVEEAAAEATRIGLDGLSQDHDHTSSGWNAQVRALAEAASVELMIAQGRRSQAMTLLAEAQRKTKAAFAYLRLVEFELLNASLSVGLEEHAAAMRHITRAVRIAAPHRIVRPFIDYGAVIAATIMHTRPSAWGFATQDERKFFAEICSIVPAADARVRDAVAAANEEPQLYGALTAREFELLGLINAGLSNQQIADRVDVKLNTIKWHLQNLYAKLGAPSRSAALAKARQMNILSGAHS